MSVLRFGYGTNGFADHRLGDALAVLSDLGYEGVALTLDHHHLDPFDAHLARRVDHVRRRLDALGLGLVIETGARYLLDPRRKHRPTLLCDDGRDRRVGLLRRAVRIGADLGAEAVSFWSGVKPDGANHEKAWSRLVEGCAAVLDEADRYGVTLGFEPEPGMLVDTLDRFDDLRAALGSPARFGLTLDVGHCVCVEPDPPDACVRRVADVLVNVQIEDMRRGVHEHLPFGEGELDVPSVLRALTGIGYRGLVSVELPRHSHAAPVLAEQSLALLRTALTREGVPASTPTPTPTLGDLWRALPDRARAWLAQSEQQVRADASRLGVLFPAVGRSIGRGPLESPHRGLTHWTLDDAGRTVLLAAIGGTPEELADEARTLYRYGDAAERRGVLRALDVLDPGQHAVDVVEDALRTNDTRLVAAALGPYGSRHLDPAAWRHGVLKCVFVGVPLDVVTALDERADSELRRMLVDYAHERVAAGRDVPDDVWRVADRGELDRLTSTREA